MSGFNQELINIVNDKKIKKYLLNCNFGLEKENVRVDKNGILAFTPHPAIFGDRLKNPYIKTDFSESQIEISTPVGKTIEEAYSYLGNIHDYVSTTLNNEYLWPQSTPPYLPAGREIPVAKMGDKEEENFRIVLAEKYGSKKQLISGIHYNFSFDEEFLKILYKELSEHESFMDFKNRLYLKICRNFMKYRWLLIYLTGASPVFHNTFIEKYVEKSCKLGREGCYFPYMTSLRNSDYGYKNRKNFYVSFDSVGDYLMDIAKLVEEGELQDIYEFYGPVRIKTDSKDNLSGDLKKHGIKYIELRTFDLNPLYKNGISLSTLYFTHLFVLYMFLKEDEDLSRRDFELADRNSHLSAFQGRLKRLKLYETDKDMVFFSEKALNILSQMDKMLTLVHLDNTYFKEIINHSRSQVINPDCTFSANIIKGIEEKSFIQFHMEKAEKYLSESKQNFTYHAALDIVNK